MAFLGFASLTLKDRLVQDFATMRKIVKKALLFLVGVIALVVSTDIDLSNEVAGQEFAIDSFHNWENDNLGLPSINFDEAVDYRTDTLPFNEETIIALKAYGETLRQSLDIDIFSELQSSQEHLQATVPSCQTLSFASTTDALLSTCASAVDYPFYVPAGISLDFFEIKARSVLNNTALTILPNACQIALKKLVCSNIYLRCPYNIQIGVPATYNFKIYSDKGLKVPIPFQRPCKSVCTNVNSKCLGILSLLGLSQDCTATYDYSSGAVPAKPFKYDPNNNASVCNAMTKTFLIGRPFESYIGGSSGACYGILTDVYIPPSSAFSTSLAPLQGPYVIQSLIEKALQTKMTVIPKYITKDCELALRKYICRSSMLKPEGETFGTAFTAAGIKAPHLAAMKAAGINVTELLQQSVYLPSYPSYEICTDFETSCATLISRATSLQPNCSKTTLTTAGVVNLYPKETQILMNLPITLSSTVKFNVAFQTDPEMASDASSSYEPSCPDITVIPDDPSDPRIIWFEGTACANKCRFVVFYLCQTY